MWYNLDMEIDHFDIYGTRMLIFIETEPQSNKYNQVLLNAEEFKKASLAIGKVIEKDNDGDDKVEFSFSKEEYILPDLKEIN